MKDKRIVNRDLELLSAYLDNELTPEQQQIVESRLEKETNLRDKLKTLSKTKSTLRSLPHLKAPRNFTLTPEMVTVKRKKHPPLVNALRLASSLAALLLVVLIGVEYVFNGGFTIGMMASEAPAAEIESYAYDESTTTPLIIIEKQEANDATGMGGGSEERAFITDDETSEEMEMEVESTPLEEDLESETVSGEVENPEIDPESSKSAGEFEEESPILGLNPDEGGEIIERSETTNPPDDQPLERSIRVFRWIELTLVILLVGGLLSLWICQRKKRL